jgi:hypothetical protein
MHLASAGEGANDGTESAAVDESDLPEVQDDGAAIAQQPGYVCTQRLALATGNNPPIAVDDGDASDITSVERKAQSPPMRLKSAREVATLYARTWSDMPRVKRS